MTLVGTTLYGTTYEGGANNDGTVFALTLPTSTLAWANSGGGSWNLPGNWNGNKVPGASAPDTVTFGNVIGSRTVTVTLDGNWAVGSLTFNTSGGGSYTIACSAGDTTSTLMLTGSVTNSGGNHTIAAPVVLGSNIMVSTTAGSSLTISGPVSESAVGSSVTLTGNGQLILSGSNSYTGGTVVEGGILVASNGSNGSATGSGTVTLSGGTLASGSRRGHDRGTGRDRLRGLGNRPRRHRLGRHLDHRQPGHRLEPDHAQFRPDHARAAAAICWWSRATWRWPRTRPLLSAPPPTTYGDYRLIGYGSLTGGLSDFDLPTRRRATMYSLSTTVDPGYIDLVVRARALHAGLAGRRCDRAAGLGVAAEAEQRMRQFNLTLEKTTMRSFVRLFGFAAAVLLLSSPLARADITWNVQSGNWSVATNWSGGAVPTSTDNADIFNGGTATITTSGELCANLYLGSTAGSGAIQHDQRQSRREQLGLCRLRGHRKLTQSGGINAISFTSSTAVGLYLGYNSGSSGTYSLSGTGQLSVGTRSAWATPGRAPSRSPAAPTPRPPIQSFFGYNSGSSGTYNLSGGLLSSNSEWLGISGTGNFTQSGGTNDHARLSTPHRLRRRWAATASAIPAS